MSQTNDSTIRRTIDQSPLFKHLSDSWQERIAAATDLETFQKGEPIIEEGQEGRHDLFVILDGKARVWTRSPKREVELKTLKPGAYFGEVSLLSDKFATATVEAKTDELRLLAVDREVVLELVDDDEKVRQMLEGVTLARAKDTIGKVME
jgi:CRP-like cAMP-binding protein